jgi:hypothetical protein
MVTITVAAGGISRSGTYDPANDTNCTAR